VKATASGRIADVRAELFFSKSINYRPYFPFFIPECPFAAFAEAAFLRLAFALQGG